MRILNLAFLLSMGISAGVGLAAEAQTIMVDQATLMNRLNRLEKRLLLAEERLFNNPVADYNGNTAAPAVATSGNMGEMELRLQEIETESTQLYGAVEQLARSVDQLTRRVEMMSQDLELRLQDIESQTMNAQQAAQIAVQNQKKIAPKAIEPAESFIVPQNLSPEDHYKRAYAFLTSAQYGAAQKWLQMFLERHSEHELADNATYWLGEVYLVEQQPEKALVTFKQGLAKYPQGRKAPANLLKMGEALKELNQHTHAKAAWDKLVQDYPGTSEAVKAKAFLKELVVPESK